MATTPTFVNIPAKTWTLAANAVQSGVIHIKTPGRYMHYWKVDGEGVPTSDDDALGIPFEGHSAVIAADEDIDVYIWCWDKTGRVRVDL